MLRFCSSRTILTATSFDLAAPTMAAKPGIRPSTSWMPQERSWISSIGPFRCPSVRDAVCYWPPSGLVKDVPPASWKPGMRFRLLIVDETDRFDRLGCQQGRHAADPGSRPGRASNVGRTA